MWLGQSLMSEPLPPSDVSVFPRLYRPQKMCADMEAVFASLRNRPWNKVHVVISGFFDPLHEGHLDYIKAASELGGNVTVIVNNNRQAVAKKGGYFHDEAVRVRIVEAHYAVYQAVLAEDEGDCVSATLARI